MARSALSGAEMLVGETLERVTVILIALAACREAFQRAGIDTSSMSLDEKRSWGVILGSGGGAPDFTEEQYRLYFSDELRKVSAYNVSSSTMGTMKAIENLLRDQFNPDIVVELADSGV